MKRSSKIIWIIVIVIIIAIAVSTWIIYANQNLKQSSSIASIKIGAILPLTGQMSRYGELEKSGLQTALEKINNNGGINGKKLEVIFEDSTSQAKGAISSWSKILLEKDINLIIATISNTCQALSPIANNDKIVLMSSDCAVASYSSPNDYTFRILSSNKKEGEQMAELLINKGIKTISIMKINNDYGEGLVKYFSEAYENMGGIIKNTESYNSDEKDFKGLLSKIKNSSPQAIYLISYAPDAEIILKQIKELNINFPLFAAEPFANNTLIKNAAQYAEGTIYLRSTISENGKTFMEEYKQKNGVNPEIGTARTYDALNVITVALKICEQKNNLTSNCIKDELYKIKDYNGTIGKIGFDINGDVDIPYVVQTVKDGQFVPYNN
ncbi:MAG: penicillin-binding protein activator [Candidatus Buchananbacteria bacterium]